MACDLQVAVNLSRTLQWRHNVRDDVSNHRRLGCSLNSLLRRRSTRHQSSVSLAFVRGIHQWSLDSPHKRASKTENVSIWWCHHVTIFQHSFSGGGGGGWWWWWWCGWGGVVGGGVEGGGGVLDLSADFYHREPVLRTVFPWRDVFM